MKTESQVESEVNKERDDLKDYQPFVKLHLDRLGWYKRTMLRYGRLDNTLYVSKTGVPGIGSSDSVCELNEQ